MYRALYVTVTVFVFTHVAGAAGNNEQFLKFLEQARAECRNGAYGPAESLFLKALDALDAGDLLRRTETLAELGKAYISEDELSKAEKVFVQALTLYKQLGDGKDIATGLRLLGVVYTLENRDDDALRTLERALKLAKQERDSELQADVLDIIGSVHYHQRNNSKAAASLTEALAIVSSTHAPVGLRAQLLNDLGSVHLAQRNYPQAEALLQEALRQIEADSGAAHPDLTWTLLSFGYLYTETRRYMEAETQYRRALSILEPLQPELETRLARVLDGLGVMYTKAGRKDEAEGVLERAAAIARRYVSQHVDMAGILEDYSASLKTHGRSSEAAEVLAEARRARTAASLLVRRPQF